MFQIGEYAVCPGHGVGQIVDIEEREMGGATLRFYAVKVIANGMKVMVPTNSENGIRPLVNENEVDGVFDVLKDHDVIVDNSTWNRRHREYMTKVKTGSLVEIAEVLRALFLLKQKKNLSFGEKKMLDQCKDLIAQEVSLSEGVEAAKIKADIDSCFPQAPAAN